MGKKGVLDLISTEIRLNESNNYPLWSYMMRHVLVARGLWEIVNGSEAKPPSTISSHTSNKESDIATSRVARPVRPPSLT